MRKGSILVVEDAGVVGLDIAHELEAMGYSVPAIVKTGEDAVRKAEEANPDVVLMDIKLKGSIDGVEAAQQIRRRLDIPVIFLTAYSDEDTLQRAKVTEPFGYLVKPFEANELRTTIEICIYKHMTEKKLRENEEKYRNLFSCSNDSIIVHELEGRILDVNEHGLFQFGYSESEILQLTVQELLSPKVPDALSQAIEEAVRDVSSNFESDFVKKNGESYSAEVSASLFRTGGKKMIQSIVRDTTDRKKAELALRESEQRYRSLIENIDLGVILIDTDHTIVMVNEAQCRMFDKTVREVLGRKCYLEFEKREIICPNCPGVSAMESGESAEVETESVRDDGTRFAVRFHAFPVFGGDGAATGFIKVVEDISEKKKLEAKFLRAKKLEAIGTLAGGIAHDLNNLLAVIQGGASAMLFDMDPSHSNYKDLKVIEQQVQRGSGLTKQLLGYARKGRYHVKPLSLRQLVEETSDTFGRTRKDITVHKELAVGPCVIEADQGQIEQVLLNVYINAAGAMPSGGKLILETAYVTHDDIKGQAYEPTPGKYVFLKVTDTGTGMDAQTLEHIFDPFFTTKELGAGTGLGLASVYGIIKGHKGYVDIDSQKGRGTTVRIYLPASNKKVEKTETRTPRQILRGTGTILVVDDEPMVLDAAVKVLEKLGYTVLEAKGGREAVEIYEPNKDKIDLVILDMIMPEMSGGQVYDKIKEINPNGKALLTSGYSLDGEARDILARGCNGFMQKPFTLAEISQCVKKILDKE